uniref:Uncharacterized protein n=1 Tax=Gopherus agassizii TaxID=38772 RepID=A0A452HUS9_9SAUR
MQYSIRNSISHFPGEYIKYIVLGTSNSPSPSSSMTTKQLQDYWRNEKRRCRQVKLLFEIPSTRIVEQYFSKYVVTLTPSCTPTAASTHSSFTHSQSIGPTTQTRSRSCTPNPLSPAPPQSQHLQPRSLTPSHTPTHCPSPVKVSEGGGERATEGGEM